MYHQFLQTVVSPNGWNCITEIHPRQDDPSRTWARNNPIQFSNAEATDIFIQGLQQRAVETYFGLASYAQVLADGKGFRAQTNVLAVRFGWTSTLAQPSTPSMATLCTPHRRRHWRL